MAGSLKDHGRREIGAVRKRINRQFALGRITEKARQELIELVDDLDDAIAEVEETEGGTHGGKVEFR